MAVMTHAMSPDYRTKNQRSVFEQRVGTRPVRSSRTSYQMLTFCSRGSAPCSLVPLYGTRRMWLSSSEDILRGGGLCAWRGAGSNG